MSLADAAHVLDQLATGEVPDRTQAVRGLHALDPVLLKDGVAQEVHDAAATLELLVATGRTFSAARARAPGMAEAVRRAMNPADDARDCSILRSAICRR